MKHSKNFPKNWQKIKNLPKAGENYNYDLPKVSKMIVKDKFNFIKIRKMTQVTCLKLVIVTHEWESPHKILKNASPKKLVCNFLTYITLQPCTLREHSCIFLKSNVWNNQLRCMCLHLSFVKQDL